MRSFRIGAQKQWKMSEVIEFWKTAESTAPGSLQAEAVRPGPNL